MSPVATFELMNILPLAGGEGAQGHLFGHSQRFGKAFDPFSHHRRIQSLLLQNVGGVDGIFGIFFNGLTVGGGCVVCCLVFGPMVPMTNSMTLAFASPGACFQGNNRSGDVLGCLLCHVMWIWDRFPLIKAAVT